MATTIVHTIKASGGDYTSLSAWEAGQQRNLVTADEIEVAECYGFIDTTPVTVSGWTVGVNNYIIIRAHSSAKATVPMTTDGSRYLLKTAVDSALIISTQYTQILDIQVEAPSYAIEVSGGGSTADRSNSIFRNCIARALNSFAWFFQGASSRLQNCIGIAYANSGRAFSHDNSNAQYDNCIAIATGANSIGYRVNSNTVGGIIFRNCIAVASRNNGFITGIGTGVGILSIDLVKSTNNASTDATAFGVNARLNQNFVFANSSIQDYHLDWMDPAARGNGTDLSASPTGSFSDDFDGNTRSAPWNIGALGVSNAPNSIRLASTGNSNIRLGSTGTSPINIR